MWTLWLGPRAHSSRNAVKTKRARIGGSDMFAGLGRTNRILVPICFATRCNDLSRRERLTLMSCQARDLACASPIATDSPSGLPVNEFPAGQYQDRRKRVYLLRST